jgi:hypothetical protein
MASLPAISTFARRHTKADEPEATRLAAEVDTKLKLARRLRDEDAARRTTSIAPPSRPVY